MKEYWPDSACAQGVDMGLFESKELHILLSGFIKRRERIIADLVAISSESECADLLAGLPPRIVNPLSNIHSSINYTPCSVNGYYGAVQWIGTYLIRLATDLEHMSKWMHVCAIITRFRGLGRLLLYELSGKFIGRVRLECIMEIRSTHTLSMVSIFTWKKVATRFCVWSLLRARPRKSSLTACRSGFYGR